LLLHRCYNVVTMFSPLQVQDQCGDDAPDGTGLPQAVQHHRRATRGCTQQQGESPFSS
jgi:hypothetical protein